MTDTPTVPIEHRVLLMRAEAAALIGMSADSLDQLIKRGILATVSLNRTKYIPRKAIDELAANYDQAPRCAQCQRERTELVEYMRRPNRRKEDSITQLRGRQPATDNRRQSNTR